MHLINQYFRSSILISILYGCTINNGNSTPSEMNAFIIFWQNKSHSLTLFWQQEQYEMDALQCWMTKIP